MDGVQMAGDLILQQFIKKKSGVWVNCMFFFCGTGV
jgi:hypothetical protein